MVVVVVVSKVVRGRVVVDRNPRAAAHEDAAERRKVELGRRRQHEGVPERRHHVGDAPVLVVEHARQQALVGAREAALALRLGVLRVQRAFFLGGGVSLRGRR